MKKNSHSTYSSIDSSSSVAKTEDRVLTDKTVKVDESTGEKSAKVKIVLEYGNNKIETNLAVLQALKQDSSDVTGKIITALTTGLTKATIEGDFNSITNNKTTVNNDKKDSVATKENTKAAVKKKTEEVIKNKSVKGTPWYATVMFWVIIATAAIAFIIYKKSWFMKFIKKLFPKALIPVLILFMFSCNNPDGKTYPADPVATGWDKGVQTYADYVIIKPTWGQAFYYNIKSGGRWEIVVGILVLFLSAGLFIAMLKNLFKVNLLNILLMMLLLAGSAAFIFTGPGTIKWNNEIRIEKAYYEQQYKDLPALWDELYSQQRIVGTSGK